MSSLPEPPPPPDFNSVFSESKRILSAHRRHFLGLSVLFLLPLSFLINTFFTFQNLLTSSQFHPHPQSLLRHHSPTTTTTTAAVTTTTTVLIIYFVVSLFLSLLAIGSISFSTYHISSGRPVNLTSSLLSLLRSFLPLFFTSLSSLLIQSLICSAFAVLMFLITQFEFLVFQTDPSSQIVFLSCLVVKISLLFVLIYLQVIWVFASVIVVVESSSCWGFEPLRRSTSLVKGMRRLVLGQMVFYGNCSAALVLGCWFLGGGDEFDGGDIRSWNSWSFVLRTVVCTAAVMLLMLNYFTAITVLYMYCKALHGEIAEEFAGEYVSLSFDDGKVHDSHGVSVIPTGELGMP